MKSATTTTKTKGDQSQRENHLHSKTHLLDYHNSANVANSAFYSNRVSASRPI